MNDYVVIGSGIGGSTSALFLNKKYKTTLFEKEPYLGGCSSTFKRGKFFYNTGATTFAGYEEGKFMYDFLSEHKVDFKKKLLDSSLTVLYNDKKIKRLRDFSAFIEEINSAFYHPKNIEFYTLIMKINKRFFEINDYYYSNKNIFAKLKSLYSFKTLLGSFYPFIFEKADKFLKNYFGNISDEYLNYIDNQVLIVAQAKTPEVNFLTCALALGYQFVDNYYIYNGMGSIFESIEEKLDDVRKSEFIEKIERKQNDFIIHSNKSTLQTKNLVLNSSLFESASLFDDKEILDYINSYKKLDLGISAFMVYMKIDTKQKLDHHYQIILDKKLKNTISNSLFVSIGASDDEKMAGSITISTHTLNQYWYENKKEKKQELMDIIKNIVCLYLNIKEEEILKCFAATPFTFKRFINRTSLGGIAVKYNNYVFKIPSNDTVIKGLYNVGDTTFAAQGWPGVMMGVRNLQRLICDI
ncbi:phytoene dehydrogenase [Malaciobacter molluscorum LMG 25693]|uniref:Phytoene dehydrogenase n=1 Tax=Malaciobacter molluscorum LMG 25693 TaxID=870501 RepID=A0A2G1DHY5_9BACT|nr:NAD(P)-binding protein [Malaciobacter molluscorum]AXX93040.1 phytoene dehydrogenase-related protein [Malaciobacter molluscorum LMG 25693]PHO18097.1 phytoene dehydrogenase [Malaciobacter molluscorum LMG 25693]